MYMYMIHVSCIIHDSPMPKIYVLKIIRPEEETNDPIKVPQSCRVHTPISKIQKAPARKINSYCCCDLVMMMWSGCSPSIINSHAIITPLLIQKRRIQRWADALYRKC